MERRQFLTGMVFGIGTSLTLSNHSFSLTGMEESLSPAFQNSGKKLGIALVGLRAGKLQYESTGPCFTGNPTLLSGWNCFWLS